MKCEAARDAARAFNLLQSLRFFSPARNARLKNTTEQKAADLPHEHHIHRGHSRKCVLIGVRLNELDAREAPVECYVCVGEERELRHSLSRKSVSRTQLIGSLSFCI